MIRSNLWGFLLYIFYITDKNKIYILFLKAIQLLLCQKKKKF